MVLNVRTRDGEYPIVLERGGLSCVDQTWNLARRCLVVTDDQVPSQYVHQVASRCQNPLIFCVKAGEASKSLHSFEEGLRRMLEAGFTRSDCVIAVGGGMVGDLAGFIASAFQRGVDFYNVPTTVLSQVDSSIGGKVAVNFCGLKNMVGAFYPPKGVLIDPETLQTLSKRQIAAGLCESVKMALTFEEELFSLFETTDPFRLPDEILEKSLRIKKRVVEEDEREADLRKVLNFGHTLAHAFETESNRRGEPLYHGECVGIGMIPMCSPSVRSRLVPVLEKLGVPTRVSYPAETLLEAISHDKKMSGSLLTVIRVEKVGSFRMEKIPFSQFAQEVKGWKA